jgi:glycerol-3-phosphate acyltransferase PlsY
MMSTLLPLLLLLLAFTLAFFLGSIPWGIIISRLVYRTDIRQHGSGNIGTTNAMRTLGKRGGILVFLLDFGKGVLAGLAGLLVAAWLLPLIATDQGVWLRKEELLAATLLGCVLGHIFSPWLAFRGGKGVAVGIGGLLVCFGWPGALIEVALFAVLVLLTRFVSLGSIAAALAFPFLALWVAWNDWLAVALCVAAAAVIIWAHRGNIQRLLKGTEPRIGKRSEGDSSSLEKG